MTATPGEAARSQANGQIRAMLGTDIVGYTDPGRRDEETRRHMRGSFYARLKEACVRSDLPWDDCTKQDQGDGALVIMPPAVAPTSLIEPLPSHLRTLIRRYNRMSAEPAKMQVRAAIHLGLVYEDEHGVTGDDVTYLCRMLDSDPLRETITDSGAEVAVSVSDYLYKTVVLRNPSLADPGQFRYVKCQVKATLVDMWLHVPGVGR